MGIVGHADLEIVLGGATDGITRLVLAPPRDTGHR
jgi:hypothetical protein